MNSFEKFVAAHPFGFVAERDMAELIALHRLCPCLVRCGGKRFVCAAQDVAGMVAAVESAGDYVRDVSITSEAMDRASEWVYRPEGEANRVAFGCDRPAKQSAPKPPRRVCGSYFNEADCGGVFDGFGVVSDADPGL